MDAHHISMSLYRSILHQVLAISGSSSRDGVVEPHRVAAALRGVKPEYRMAEHVTVENGDHGEHTDTRGRYARRL